MAEGKMTLEFDNGELKGIFINTALDQIYRRMYLEAKRDSIKYSSDIEDGIRVVIFGAFYLEALCNSLFKEKLLKQIESPTWAKSIWSATKKMGIIEKLKLVTEAKQTSKDEETKEYFKKIQRVFELRNRLAHFKDEDWEIMKLLDYNALPNLENMKDLDSLALFQALKLPEPDLMTKLRDKELEQYSCDIEAIEKWIITVLT